MCSLESYSKCCWSRKPCNIGFIRKTAGMHWLGCNDAVLWLNEAKTRIFWPVQLILKFSKLTCISSATLPYCARCRGPEISYDKGNIGGLTKLHVVPKTIACFSMAISVIFSKVTIACYGFCLLRHTNKPARIRDIFSYIHEHPSKMELGPEIKKL